MKAIRWLLLIFFIGTVIWGCAGAETPSNAAGYLQISSTPSGAAVYLDEVYQGVTPPSNGFINITILNPREYRLVLKKPVYLDYISTVNIVSGQTVKVSATLQVADVTAQENPGNSVMTGVLIVIVVLVLVGVLVLYIRHRRKPKEPAKVELD